MKVGCGACLRVSVTALGAITLVSGCASDSRDLYSERDVGVMIDTTEAVVVASRPVEIEAGPTAVGPVAGGISAAIVVGALTGGGFVASLATAAGGLLGFGAGYVAEREITRGEGVEYVLETFDGRTMTIVQRDDDEPRILNGTPVLLQMSGGYSRVIEHPSIDADAPQGEWSNPDALQSDLHERRPDDVLAPLLER